MTWDLVYIIAAALILPIYILALIISARVTTVINKYHHLPATGGITAKELVERIAATHNLAITVEKASNSQGDHYDSRAKAVRLTDKVYNGTSVSALAVAAHECGHALQDAQNYFPLRLRHVCIKVSNFGSRLLTPLIIVSLILSLFSFTFVSDGTLQWLLLGFCIVYGLTALVGLVTLPTEFDASRRGKKLLREMGMVDNREQERAVSKVLGAAANTYVISFALSLVYFLRYLAIFMSLRDSKR